MEGIDQSKNQNNHNFNNSLLNIDRSEMNASELQPVPLEASMNIELQTRFLQDLQSKIANTSSDMRQKRRSKHEAIGRDFVCKLCGKSYLSSSSIY